MKINILTYVFWPENFLINELALGLKKLSHEVSVLTQLPNYQTGSIDSKYSLLKGPFFENEDGLKIYRFRVIPRKKNFIFLILNYLSFSVMAFLNVFRHPKADVFFIFATSPLIVYWPIIILKKLGFYKKTKFVVWYQDLWPESFFAITQIKTEAILGKILNSMILFFVRSIYKSTDLMLIQNASFESQLRKYGYQGRIEILYNWAPQEGFKIKIDESELAEVEQLRSQNKFIITFSGNIGLAQAFPEILQALSKIEKINSNIHFVIAGTGRFLNEALEIKKQLDLKQISFIGHKEISLMPKLYELSDALLVSLQDDSTFNSVIPSKLQNYMRAGKPIIGFLNGAGADVILSAKCGLVAEAQNVESFLKVITQMYEASNQQKLNWSANSKLYYEQNFTFDKCLEKTDKLLKSILL